MDVVDRATRSRMMSGIRGRDTKPEKLVRSFLHRAGLRFRLHTSLPGKPDLVFPKHHAVVFVHGCFWHRHAGCRYATMPTTNAAFWQAKFAANVARDNRVTRQLRKEGWRVYVAWSCRIDESRMQSLSRKIRGE
ncbi:MAG: DNA mismatch endonuclease Vsr [Proteobacteria bacterium]|nr:DNA mismatch endonuclease Vsr [Pseudomonadota bacterium]